MHTTLLAHVRVLELGTRPAVGVCAGLLRDAGAVIRRLHMADLARQDHAALQEAVGGVHLVLLSSDTCAEPAHQAVLNAARNAGTVIVCDITAGGPSGLPPYPCAPHTDMEIQALTGLMDTTGFTDAPPAPIGFRYCEVSAGMYAAAAATAALVAWRRTGLLQNVNVSLYGAAANALTTFLPHVFAGKDPHRLGNRHSSAAPWNAYRTADGWALICTSSQEQWLRLAALIGGAADDTLFASSAARVQHVAQLDRVVEQWTIKLSTAACLQLCADAEIPAGPILGRAQLADEPNIRHRGMLRATPGGWQCGAPFRMSALPATAGRGPARLSPPGAAAEGGPLAGIRVIEIGQYTTAPLVGKHLATLGAEVIKIEPPGGDPTRDWPHGQGDTSYFFALSNTDKLSATVDLKAPAGKARLRELLADADVLVENLRPGAMARLGFSPRELAAINPRLLYCAISGFGADSAYLGRPAFDTVIQAMSGIMDCTRSAQAPVKAGVSAADILSGQVALFSIVAAIVRRGASGPGGVIDIAMQDVAVWAAFAAPQRGPASVLPYADGYLLLEADAVPDGFEAALAPLARGAALALCAARGIRAIPVNSVAQAMHDPRLRSQALGLGQDLAGRFWPVLQPPYRFSRSPGPLGTVLAPKREHA